jgi:hypothetical protein
VIDQEIKKILEIIGTKIYILGERDVKDYDFGMLEVINSLVIVVDALLAKIKVLEMMHGPDGY